MTTMQQLRADVRVLLDGWTQRELLRTFRHDGLLNQLRDQITESGGLREENRSGKAVTPGLPADESALSLTVEMEQYVGELVRWAGATRPSGDVANNLRWLVREAEAFDDESVKYLAQAVGHIRARIESELEWTPRGRPLRVACPKCKTKRVVAYAHDPGKESAVCVDCKTRWLGEDGLRELAKIIKEETCP